MPGLVPVTLIYGRYRVVRPIGRGGMGAVYEAIDTRLQVTVAIKQLTLDGPEAARAFEHEAKLLAGLRHPSLTLVTDYFVEDGVSTLVMQYIEGEDLARLQVRRDGRLSPTDVAAWAHAVLDALRYLHRHTPPILHRDIKPANLKLTPGGEIVLLDFGLAKGGLDAATTVTPEKSLLGFTLKYAPIEQIEGRGTDARSDLYALGATLYHLATGIQPASALDRARAARNGQSDPLVDPRRLTPPLTDPFCAVVMRALALESTDRFETAEAMKAALLHGALRSADTPRPHSVPGADRRVDAAMPSQPVVGEQADLIVQVRFPDSPRLGLEDWPTHTRPAEIEQGSEPLRIVYPRDPETGVPLPARLRIKVVAPDFTIAGQTEHQIEVPPGEYSKRLAFLLTPRRAGYRRINVEVYALDALHLGTIPVETEAVTTGIAQQILRVASLVLGVSARHPPAVEDRRETVVVPALLPPPRATMPSHSRLSAQTAPDRPARSGSVSKYLVTAPIVAMIGIGIVLMRTTVLDDGPSPSVPQATLPSPPEMVAPSSVNSLRDTFSVVPSRRTIASANHPALHLGAEFERASGPGFGRPRIVLLFKNDTGAPVLVSFDYSKTRVSGDRGERYAILTDSAGTKPGGVFSTTLPMGAFNHWIELDEPAAPNRTALTIDLLPGEGSGSAVFPPFSIALR